MDHHGEFKLMEINHQGAKEAWRRIPLPLDTALYEIFGNISSKSMISLKISDDFDFIYIFSEDKWDESDKKALQETYSSGTFIKASHINGKGIKLTLDRILDETPAIYCIQGQDDLYYTSEIGHYTYTEWKEMNENEIEIYKSNIRNITNGEKSSGTYIKIPVNNEYKALLEKKGFNYCKKLFNKFFNRLPFIKQNVLLFNNKKQEFEPLCKNYIELDCSIVWDTKKKGLSSCNNELLLINNYKSIKKFFPFLQNLIKLKSVNGAKSNQMKKIDLTKKYTIKKGRINIENFKIRISILSKKEAENQTNYFSDSLDDLRGLQVYYGNNCLTRKGIYKYLGGKSGKDGEGGAIGSKYGGHERFEIELLNKDSKLFYLPQDKTNIKPKTIGLKILKFIRFLMELHPDTKNNFTYKNMDELTPTPPSQPTNDPSNNPQVDPIVTPSPPPSHHKRHHPTPGGYLYVITTPHWLTKQVHKLGETGNDDLDFYIQNEHQRKCPIDKIKLICAYKIPSGLDALEKDILSEIEKQGYRFYTDSTSTSEFFINIDECKKIIENFKTNRWEEVEESKFF